MVVTMTLIQETETDLFVSSHRYKFYTLKRKGSQCKKKNKTCLLSMRIIMFGVFMLFVSETF